MVFNIQNQESVPIEIKTPSFYVHYGIFYKVTDKTIVIVGKHLIFTIDAEDKQGEYYLKAISDGKCDEITQGLFIAKFDDAMEYLQTFRV